MGSADVVAGVLLAGAGRVVLDADVGRSEVLEDDVVGSSSSVLLGAVVVGRDDVERGVELCPVVVGAGAVVVAGASVVVTGCTTEAGLEVCPAVFSGRTPTHSANTPTNSTTRTTVEVRARPIRAGSERGQMRAGRATGPAGNGGTGVVG